MIHPLNEDQLAMVRQMDEQIGRFMQKRAEVVNQLISDIAQFDTGDFVDAFQEGNYCFTAQVVQPLFLKKQGMITYRLRKEDGSVFTNETFKLQLAENQEREDF